MKSVLTASSALNHAQRWDFSYHDPAYIELVQSLDRGHPVVRFGDIITLLTDMGAFSLYKTEYFVDEGIPFLRVQNVQEYGVDLAKDTKYITREYHEQLKKSQLAPGDLLITTKAVVGVAAVVDDQLGECNMSQNLVRIHLAEGINPRYIAAFLNSRFGRTQTETSATGPNQKYLNFGRIRGLRIPLPPRPVQDRIAQMMQDAYAARRAKLAEAEASVDGIDDKIREALGIQVGTVTDERAFVMSASELEDRFDFKVYDRRYVSIVTAIEKGRYSVSRFGELCLTFPHRGTQPLYVANGDVLVLKTVNVGAGTIDFASALRTTWEFLQSVSGRRAKAQRGDLLITSTGDGSWGRASVFDTDANCIVDGHVTIVQLKAGYSPSFYEVFLNSSLGQAQFWQRYRGHTGQTEFYPDDIAALRVPVPPREVQDRLATEIHDCRKRAQFLRSEAETLVTEAKARVERMILGEERVP